MDKVIVGIHGLSNKPEKDILRSWWQQSIEEGLKKNSKKEYSDLKFEMVYWADLLYRSRMHQEEGFEFDELYNKEPYVQAKSGALQEYKKSWRDSFKEWSLDKIGDSVDYLKQNFGMDSLADWMLSKVLKDLAFYYDKNRLIADRSKQACPACVVLKNELLNTLKDVKGKDIMLISHSMGSIIAYDALRDLGQSDPDFEISHFVTIGSPLGLPHVKGKIIQERAYDPIVRTPSIVKKTWVNYADKRDPVALDSHLASDYDENSSKVGVEDDLVANDYVGPGAKAKNNYHKSYGYLRTPEISRHINKFLAGKI